MSAATQAKAVDEADLRERLKSEKNGCFVAIEPYSREFFVTFRVTEAAMTAKSAHPDKTSCVIRVGCEAAINIGSIARWLVV